MTGTDAKAHADYLAVRSFGSLDGIRCFSILAVIWHHTDRGLDLGRAMGRGFLGVDMFFVLSGFLIVTLLLRERRRAGEISLRAFYARRSLRIFPLYLGIVLLCAVLFGLVRPDGEAARDFFHDLPFLLTYTTNLFAMHSLLGITWSLSAEEQFYLLWPPIERYVPGKMALLVGFLVVSQLIQFELLDGLGVDWPGMLRQTTFTPILLGVLLAQVLDTPRGFGIARGLLGHRHAGLALLTVLLACLHFMPVDLQGWPRPVVHLLMAALLCACVVREDHGLRGVLAWPPVVRIGVLSYGMYLWHMFVVHVVMEARPGVVPPQLQFVLTLAGTLAVAELSYRFYEQPFLRLKRRFAVP